MSTVRDKLRHAFAVDPPGPAEPAPDQQAVVDRFCREVARRHAATPGLIALEMSRPLNFIASQTMHFFGPAVWALVRPRTWDQYKQFAAYLERRGAIDYLIGRIEHFEKQLNEPSNDQDD